MKETYFKILYISIHVTCGNGWRAKYLIRKKKRIESNRSVFGQSATHRDPSAVVGQWAARACPLQIAMWHTLGHCTQPHHSATECHFSPLFFNKITRKKIKWLLRETPGFISLFEKEKRSPMKP